MRPTRVRRARPARSICRIPASRSMPGAGGASTSAAIRLSASRTRRPRAGAMDWISGLQLSPAQEWDALICTSTVVKQTVEFVLDAPGGVPRRKIRRHAVSPAATADHSARCRYRALHAERGGACRRPHRARHRRRGYRRAVRRPLELPCQGPSAADVSGAGAGGARDARPEDPPAAGRLVRQ